MYSILVSLWSLCTQALHQVPGNLGNDWGLQMVSLSPPAHSDLCVELSFGEYYVPRLYYERCVSNRCTAYHLTTSVLITFYTSAITQDILHYMQSSSLMLLEVLPLTEKTSFITFSGPPLHVKCIRLYFTYAEIYIWIEFLLNILRFCFC